MKNCSLIIWIIILLQLSHGHISVAPSCDLAELLHCQAQIGSFSHGTSDLFAENEEDLTRECRLQQDAIACVKNMVQRCMKPEERQIFWHSTGGKLKLLAEICADTETNKRYIENLECFQRIRNDSTICQRKFEVSQTKIKNELDEERRKTFHTCCSYDWLRQCKIKATEKYCGGGQAAEFIDYMSTTLGGEVLVKICESKYPSCYGELYGFDRSEQNNNGKLEFSVSTIILALILIGRLKNL